MHIVVGPVLTRKGGYAFDCWTPDEGLSRGYTYGRIEDARHARNFEIRSRKTGDSDHTIARSTVDDFRAVNDLTDGIVNICPIQEEDLK